VKKNKDVAVAVRYDGQKDNAPRVIAKGKGQVAQKIRAIATSAGIPLHKDDDLVELLSHIELDDEIPPELYAAVAELLSWIYRANSASG
jgi:flagellar biosynthesis protein